MPGIRPWSGWATAEALDEAVLDGLAWPDEVQPHSAPIRPGVHLLRVELARVVDRDDLRVAPLLREGVDRRGDRLPAEARVSREDRALAGEGVHDRQCPDPRSVHQLVRGEVHGPALVRHRRRRGDHAQVAEPLLPDLGTHGKPFLAADPVRFTFLTGPVGGWTEVMWREQRGPRRGRGRSQDCR